MKAIDRAMKVVRKYFTEVVDADSAIGRDITLAILAAEEAEREACAKVASKCGLSGLRAAAAIRARGTA